MIVERQIFFRGRVQGVGFRYTVKRLATGYEVTGWVQNLPDGRVELQVKGDSTEVDSFLEAIAASHLRQHINERLEGNAIQAFEGLKGFEIRLS